MSYPIEKIGEYIDIQSGFAFKSKDFCDSGVPVIKIKNITPPSVSLEDVDYVSSEIALKQSKFLLEYNDVLIAMTGSHINQMASVVGRIARVKYTKPSLLNQRVGKITVKNSNLCDLDYIYYFLSQDEIKIKLASKAGGAANQANISPSDIKSLLAPIPDIETQHKIASILSNYDNLIENNQKQIKLLEEAAQRLYREWFVDLRFPGHETVNVVDGVPEGWRKGNASDFFDITIGKTPPRAEKKWFTSNKTGIPWVSISDMGNADTFLFSTNEELTEDAIKSHNIKVFPSGTILVSFKLTVGRVTISSCDMCSNEAIAHFYIQDDALREYAYCYLKCFEYDTLGNTSSISKAVNSKIIKAMPFIMPSREVVECFSHLLTPIFQEIYTKQKTIMNLTEARDRLLPKLMSGELEV